MPERSGQSRHWLIALGVGVGAILIAAMALFFVPQARPRRELVVRVGNDIQHVRTRRAIVGAVLKDLGIALYEGDRVEPAVDAPVVDNGAIVVERAYPVWIEADGKTAFYRTHAQTVGELLQEASIGLGLYDRLVAHDVEVSSETPLAALPHNPTALYLKVERAVPFVLCDGDAERTLHTTAKLVGEALWRAGITVYLGDTVSPGLEAPISPGMRVEIARSRPLTIVTKDRAFKTRAQGPTVGDALAREGIRLAGKDYSEPAPDTPLEATDQVRVFHVVEEWIVQDEAISYGTQWQADESLEIDHHRVVQGGKDGLRKRRFRITYVDGHETERVLEAEWIAQEPTPRIVFYGTKIVLREIETPEGVKKYWRHFRALATSYTAATSGKSRDHPQYGITYMGWQARKGIIAVDPRVVRLTTNMYVPGYGLGVAGDTGGKIKGRRIDLCYDEDNLVLWHKWVDVYLLEPVPPRDQINWILPNWPREP